MRIQFEFYSFSLSLSCFASLTCCRDAYQCRSQILFAFPNSLFCFVCALGLAALVFVRHLAEHKSGRERVRESHALSDTFATVCGVSQQTSFDACGASFALRYFLPVEPSTLTCLDVFMDKRFDELLKVQAIQQQQKQQHYQNKPRKNIWKSKPNSELKYKLNR